MRRPIAIASCLVASTLASSVAAAQPAEAPPVATPVVAPAAPADNADLQFQRKEIHIGSRVLIENHELVRDPRSHRWTALRGDLETAMTPAEFYAAVGRDDLVERQRGRRRTAVQVFTLSGLSLFASVGLFTGYAVKDLDNGAGNTKDHTLLYAGAATMFLSGVLAAIGSAYAAEPIDATEAKRLADHYNQGVRRELGLPSLSRRAPVLRDVKLAPYVAERGGGLAMAARF